MAGAIGRDRKRLARRAQIAPEIAAEIKVKAFVDAFFQRERNLVMPLGMAHFFPFSFRTASVALLPLALASTAALAQSDVKEDSVVLQPDRVADDAPTVKSEAEVQIPDWSRSNARALLDFIQNVGAEGLFSKDYDPDGQIGRAHV